jgi:anaerobic selenocysteine-containing dehydrogenase
MTNHWRDIGNSNVILVIGANPAENHPASFGHISDAIDNGAKLINIDPRFTRTSSKAHIYSPMRSGGDIAVIGGLIKHVIAGMESNPSDYNMTYVTEYTNAPYLINEGFQGPVDLDGLFSGYNPESRSYNKSTWAYQLDDNGIPKRDKTLQNPNCVFQHLKKHFSRYDIDTVVRTTGANADTIQEIYETYAASGKEGESGTIMYAMGTTQHTNGTQMIRSYAILQLLLANIGVAGGGINALRGESNVQGSTDMCLLWHILPGYLKVPVESDVTLDAHNTRATPTTNDPKSANWWGNYPKYIISLLKAWYGDNATADNEFAFHNLGKVDSGVNYSHIALFHAMDEGTIKGMTVWGQNPAVCSPNLNMVLSAMDKLDWLVVADLWDTETASFWKRPGANTASIGTEVFLLPAACCYEKEGSVTNSGRWMQWRYKAVEPPGDALPDLDIINTLMLKIKSLYAAEGGANAKSITDLTWNYGTHPDPLDVAREVNGYDLTTGKLMTSFGGLKTDGTTTAGNWLYTNSFVEPESMDAFEKANPEMYPGDRYLGNRACRAYPIDVGAGGYSAADGYKEVGLFNYFSWTWPVNRRVIYNRASVDLQGNPFDAEHPIIEFKGAVTDGKYTSKSWKGDVPDGGWYPMQNPDGTDRADTKYPFIMKPEGHARIFGAGRTDGPFPEHYEPWESPISNPISKQQNDPVFKIWDGPMDHKGDPSKYPIICTTFRLVEHWQSGQMSRNLPWLVEMVPEMFVELSEELAASKGVESGDKVKVSSARGEIEVNALVTKRFKPYTLDGKVVHQIGLPWHFGFIGLATGASANTLTPNVGDANTMIPEYKAFLVNLEKA